MAECKCTYIPRHHIDGVFLFGRKEEHMKRYLKEEELNKKLSEGKDDDETKELFIELIGLLFEENDKNQQLFLDGVMNGEINSKMLIASSTQEFSDKKTFVTYLSHLSRWINHQINQIAIDIKDDDPRLDKLSKYGIKNGMGIVLKSIAMADSSSDTELKKIYYMIAYKYFRPIDKNCSMYTPTDLFPCKYFEDIENLAEEILIKYYYF